MRLLIIGTLNGQLTAATKIAVERGANVTHATDIAQANVVAATETAKNFAKAKKVA